MVHYSPKPNDRSLILGSVEERHTPKKSRTDIQEQFFTLLVATMLSSALKQVFFLCGEEFLV